MAVIVYNSVEAVEAMRRSTKEIADHFGSDIMAEHYLNGLIDWDGKALCEDCPGPCQCGFTGDEYI